MVRTLTRAAVPLSSSKVSLEAYSDDGGIPSGTLDASAPAPAAPKEGEEGAGENDKGDGGGGLVSAQIGEVDLILEPACPMNLVHVS